MLPVAERNRVLRPSSSGNADFLTRAFSSLQTRERSLKAKMKSALDFAVQDASAALPQNCQTTKWMLRGALSSVNVTLVMGCSPELSRLN